MTGDMTLHDFANLLSTIGWPGIAAVVCWRGFVFLKPHIAGLFPLLYELLKGHISLMGALEKTQVVHGSVLDKVSKTQDEHGLTLEEIRKHVAT